MFLSIYDYISEQAGITLNLHWYLYKYIMRYITYSTYVHACIIKVLIILISTIISR